MILAKRKLKEASDKSNIVSGSQTMPPRSANVRKKSKITRLGISPTGPKKPNMDTQHSTLFDAELDIDLIQNNWYDNQSPHVVCTEMILQLLDIVAA